MHDVGNYRDRKLQPGMVFSIDPMIWVPEEVPQRRARAFL